MAPLHELPDGLALLISMAMSFLAELTPLQCIEYLGAALSIAGAELVSRKGTRAPWGWAFWMVANFAFLAVSITNQLWGLAITQAWFLKTSLTGIYNHLLPSLRAMIGRRT